MKEQVSYRVFREGEWPEIVPRLWAGYGDRHIWCIYGDLGVGKTTLIKYLCAHFRVRDNVSSPTFSLINQYLGEGRAGEEVLIYHLDLYRLETLEEVLQIGIEEILERDALVLIEWPELIEPLLSGEEGVLRVRIEESPDGGRKLFIL